MLGVIYSESPVRHVIRSLKATEEQPDWIGNIFSSGKRLLVLPTCRGNLYLKVSFLLYQGFKANLSLLRRPGEKTYTQRCRLFVGNLPADITEDEFKRLFAKYGEPGEVFINKGKGFGFIKLVSLVFVFFWWNSLSFFFFFFYYYIVFSEPATL